MYDLSVNSWVFFFFFSPLSPSCAFVTFEKMESADQAVVEVSVKIPALGHAFINVRYKMLMRFSDFS